MEPPSPRRSIREIVPQAGTIFLELLCLGDKECDQSSKVCSASLLHGMVVESKAASLTPFTSDTRDRELEGAVLVFPRSCWGSCWKVPCSPLCILHSQVSTASNPALKLYLHNYSPNGSLGSISNWLQPFLLSLFFFFYDVKSIQYLM